MNIKGLIHILCNLLVTPIHLIRKNNISLSSRVSWQAFLCHTTVHNYCYIGPFTSIKNTIIKNYCAIAPSVVIGGMEHPYQFASTSTHLFPKNLLNEKQTIVEEDVWIGANVNIKQGVRIGRGAVIGASSLVLKDVPPYSIVIGTPAKVHKMRFSDDVILELEKSRYWEKSPSEAKELIKSISHFHPMFNSRP